MGAFTDGVDCGGAPKPPEGEALTVIPPTIGKFADAPAAPVRSLEVLTLSEWICGGRFWFKYETVTSASVGESFPEVWRTAFHWR
jgi:hypothetical protein